MPKNKNKELIVTIWNKGDEDTELYALVTEYDHDDEYVYYSGTISMDILNDQPTDMVGRTINVRQPVEQGE